MQKLKYRPDRANALILNYVIEVDTFIWSSFRKREDEGQGDNFPLRNITNNIKTK